MSILSGAAVIRSPATTRRIVACVTLFAFALLRSSSAEAQTLKEIGKTTTGDPVFIETGSVKKADGIITASVLARFAKPTKASFGDLYASRTIVMFDCVKQVVAVKENWYYLDAAGKKIGTHKVVGKPGYGTVFKGSVPDVAMKYLCSQTSTK